MKLFQRICLLTVVLCFALVVLGAFVRLSNAGLGCPDWPGCYGHLTVPTSTAAVHSADAAYPLRPVHAPKAWKEMGHRYLAGIVGLLVLFMAFLAGRGRGPRVLPFVVLGIILVQIVFGALTVTLKVDPLIVTTHLLLGMATLALLWWMWLRQRAPGNSSAGLPGGARVWAAIALVVLAVQIFLGGWVSTNYAAVACPDFPTCQGSYLLQGNFWKAFDLWHRLGVDYQGGTLSSPLRATIHMTHRYGALLTTLVLGGLGLQLLLWGRRGRWHLLGIALLLALALQVAFGISFVVFQFPLWLGDAHNGGAALLLLVVVAVNHFVWTARPSKVVES